MACCLACQTSISIYNSLKCTCTLDQIMRTASGTPASSPLFYCIEASTCKSLPWVQLALGG